VALVAGKAAAVTAVVLATAGTMGAVGVLAAPAGGLLCAAEGGACVVVGEIVVEAAVATASTAGQIEAA
jgi:hypothetical protein